jgi:hypothetical protein
MSGRESRPGTAPGELPNRGLVHFSADRHRHLAGLMTENMDLTPLRQTLQNHGLLDSPYSTHLTLRSSWAPFT